MSELLADRRRAALARADAMRRHPTRRVDVKPNTPPPTAFYVMVVVITVFTMLGLVMVLSATSISQFHQGNSPWRLFNRQLVWASLGLVGLWCAMRIPTSRWRPLVYPAFLVACGAMVLPFLLYWLFQSITESIILNRNDLIWVLFVWLSIHTGVLAARPVTAPSPHQGRALFVRRATVRRLPIRR